MIVLLTGYIGSGKSRFALHCALKAARLGRNVVHDLPLTSKGLEMLPAPVSRPLVHLDEVPVNSLVIADECGADLATASGAGLRGGLPMKIRAGWAQSRHRGFDLIIVSQSAEQLTTQLRALVDRTYIMKPPGWLGKFQRKQIVSVYEGCRDPGEISRMPPKMRPLLDRFSWAPEPGLHDLYHSIDPGADFSSGVGLPQTGRPSVMARLLTLPIVFAIISLTLLWFAFPNSEKSSAPFFAPEPPAAVSLVCSRPFPSLPFRCTALRGQGRKITPSPTRLLAVASSSNSERFP